MVTPMVTMTRRCLCPVLVCLAVGMLPVAGCVSLAKSDSPASAPTSPSKASLADPRARQRR